MGRLNCFKRLRSGCDLGRSKLKLVLSELITLFRIILRPEPGKLLPELILVHLNTLSGVLRDPLQFKLL